MHPIRIVLLLATAAPSLVGQSNAVAGTEVNLYDVGSSIIYGRRGAAYPGGEVGIGFGHSFCNGGTVHIPWATSPTTSGQMTDVHFKIAFLLARESNGRIVQVSTAGSYAKHSRVTYNLGSSNCGTCQSGPGSTFRIGCFDSYSTGFNGDRFNLGPTSEIDPWTGSWNPVGSYFDRGDPAVGGTAASDGTQSLTQTQVSSFDSVKNRVTVPESELSQAGTYYGQVHLVCEGEPVANRSNNLLSDRLNFTWSGSSWSTSNAGGAVQGSVLNRWAGATRNLGGNGSDDGRFLVAAKVTGPVAGVWHYEYAVHNIDNARGGASLRIPLHPSATLTNAGFRDIDGNALNQWTWSRNGSELACLAAANNPLDWNSIYNFWFDATVGPAAGAVTIDEARVGPGALTVSVASEVPNGTLSATAISVGSGCFGLALAVSAPPVLGTTVQLTTSGIPAGSPFGLTVVTITQAVPPIDLSAHGMAGCFGHVQGGENLFWFAPGATAQVSLVVPNNAGLSGLPVVGQSFANTNPPLTALGLIASNGVAMVVGVQ
jgi:hypothetical protein